MSPTYAKARFHHGFVNFMVGNASRSIPSKEHLYSTSFRTRNLVDFLLIFILLMGSLGSRPCSRTGFPNLQQARRPPRCCKLLRILTLTMLPRGELTAFDQKYHYVAYLPFWTGCKSRQSFSRYVYSLLDMKYFNIFKMCK